MSRGAYTIRPLKSAAPLSKSRFVHGMQCPLYVWLEVRTDAPRAEVDAFTQALFDTGDEVGEHARLRWDRRLERRGQAAGPAHERRPEAARRDRCRDAGRARRRRDGDPRGRLHPRRRQGPRRRARAPRRTARSRSTRSSRPSKYDEKQAPARRRGPALGACGEPGLEVSRVTLVHLNGLYEWPGGEYDLEQLFAEEDVTGAAEALQEVVGLDVARLLRVLGSDVAAARARRHRVRQALRLPLRRGLPLARTTPVEHPVDELPGSSDAVERAGAGGRLRLAARHRRGPAAARILTYADGTAARASGSTPGRRPASGERIVLGDARPLDRRAASAPSATSTSRPSAAPSRWSRTRGRSRWCRCSTRSTSRATTARPSTTSSWPPRTTRTRGGRCSRASSRTSGDEGAIIHWSSYEKTVIEQGRATTRATRTSRAGLEALRAAALRPRHGGGRLGLRRRLPRQVEPQEGLPGAGPRRRREHDRRGQRHRLLRRPRRRRQGRRGGDAAARVRAAGDDGRAARRDPPASCCSTASSTRGRRSRCSGCCGSAAGG